MDKLTICLFLIYIAALAVMVGVAVAADQMNAIIELFIP
jgi:hypothetical protein